MIAVSDEMAKRAIEEVAECLHDDNVNDNDWPTRRRNYYFALVFLAQAVFIGRTHTVGSAEIRHPDVVDAVRRNWPKPGDGYVPWS